MTAIRNFFLGCFFLSQLNVGSIKGSPEERRLLNDLMEEYDINVRPAKNASHSLKVIMGIALMQIIDLYWNDYHLRWNASEYGGIDTIFITANRIWLPDITLYNSVSEDLPPINKYYASISSNGDVMWLAPAVIMSSCQLEVTFFPWDIQFCNLQFGSWSLDGSLLDLQNRQSKGDMSSFITNGEWNLIDIPARLVHDYQECCEDPFPSIHFTVIISRKPLYYISTLIMPCAFITFCALLVFWLPPESGEKISLAITIVLATTVFLLLIAETLPTQSTTIPLISVYFIAVLIVLSTSTVFTVVVLMLHNRGDLGEEVPAWMRKIFLDWLAKATFMTNLVNINKRKRMVSSKKIEALEQQEAEAKKEQEKADKEADDNSISIESSDPEKASLFSFMEKAATHATETTRLDRILAMLQMFKLRLSESRASSRRTTEWMLCAQIFDRFLFYMFTIVIITVHLVILMSREDPRTEEE